KLHDPLGRGSRPEGIQGAASLVRQGRDAGVQEPMMDAAVKAMPAIDSALDRALDEQRIVGAVVLIARDGEIVYRRAAGLADRERGIPMREQAVFRLASLTKPLV